MLCSKEKLAAEGQFSNISSIHTEEREEKQLAVGFRIHKTAAKAFT